MSDKREQFATDKKIKPTLTVTENKLKEEKLCRWEKLARSSNVAKKNWGEMGKKYRGGKKEGGFFVRWGVEFFSFFVYHGLTGDWRG